MRAAATAGWNEVLGPSWIPGTDEHWDRISALRQRINEAGGIGRREDTAAVQEARIRAVESVFVDCARDDVNDYVAYTVVDPATGGPVFQEKAHREFQDALASGGNVDLAAHRGLGKTTQAMAALEHLIGTNPSELIKLVSEGSATAEERVRDVGNNLLTNPRVRRVFPHLAAHPGMPWTDHSITVARDLRNRNPTLGGYGMNAAAVGGRYSLLLGDDATPPEAMFSEAIRNRSKKKWNSVWAPMGVSGSRTWFVYTPWNELDLTAHIRSLDSFRHLFFAVGGPEGCYSCPENNGEPCDIPFHNPWTPRVWTPEKLRGRYNELGAMAYELAFRLNARALGTTLFKPAYFEGSDVMRTDMVLGEPGRIWRGRGVLTVIGVDLSLGGEASHDWVVIFVLGFDEFGTKYVVDIQRFRSADYRDHIARIAAVSAKYDPELVYVESTGFQRLYADMLQHQTSIPVRPFLPLGAGHAKKTEGAPKKDLVWGVPGLAAEMQNRKWRFPIGDAASKEKIAIFQAECQAFVFTDEGKLEGVGSHDDTVMAAWAANSAARRMGAGMDVPEAPTAKAIAKTDIGGQGVGVEDFARGKGPSSTPAELGLRSDPSAGTAVRVTVPANFPRPSKRVYSRIYKALSMFERAELEAVARLTQGGTVPEITPMLAAGVPARVAGPVFGLAKRDGSEGVLYVLGDCLREVQEAAVLMPLSEEPDFEDLLGADGADEEDELDRLEDQAWAAFDNDEDDGDE